MGELACSTPFLLALGSFGNGPEDVEILCYATEPAWTRYDFNQSAPWIKLLLPYRIEHECCSTSNMMQPEMLNRLYTYGVALEIIWHTRNGPSRTEQIFLLQS